MGEIVNLNRVRKAHERAEAKTQAAANRAAHGRSKVEKSKDRADAARREAVLDGAKREPRPDPAGKPD